MIRIKAKSTSGSASLFLLVILFLGCSSGQTEFTIVNNLNLDRQDEPIILTRSELTQKNGEQPIRKGKLPLPYLNEKPIPAQVDDIDMDGTWDELAFTIDIPAKSSQSISIQFVEPNEYPKFDPKTSVRFGVLEKGNVQSLDELSIAANEVPPPPFSRFQMDGPAWENNKVGFRHYIDGRNARDVYGKTVPEISLDSVGISSEGTLEDNYHVMRPWGRDILSVGNSLGLGGLAILRNDQPVRLGVRIDDTRNNVEKTTYKLIKEGPVRTIFRLTYENWQTGIDTLTLINDVTIWAGQYFHTNEIHITSSGFNADTLLTGLVNIHNDKSPNVISDSESGYSAFYTHDMQTYDDEWFLGMALLFPNQNYLGYFEAPETGQGITNTFLLQFELTDEKKLKYDALAGWELSDQKFADSLYFANFVSDQLLKRSNPILIE